MTKIATETALAKVWGNTFTERRDHVDRELTTAWGTSSNQVPTLFRKASPTNPEVMSWLNGIVHNILPANENDPYRPYPKIQGGASLLLLGPTGSGKTHEAIGVFTALLTLGAFRRGVIVTAPDLYAKMRPRPHVDAEEVFNEYGKASFLVLDDIGADKPTEWTQEVLYRLVNYRYSEMMPTIFTSNNTPQQLAAMVGDRVASRLTGMCTKVVLKERDRRRA